ncbi:MAG: hypothetical protein KKC01_10925, partial [Gammaproteobacteria bacterium]|nr:hypothetical protein [Gammaproteobacteria bacterium]
LYVAGEPGFIGPGEPGQLFSRNLSTGLLTSLDDLEELSLIGQPATTFSSDGTRLYYRDVLGDSPPIPVLGSLRRDQASGEMSAEAMALTSANSAGFDDDLALAENGRLLAIADRLGLFITPVIGGEFIDLQDQISNSLVDATLATAVTFSPDEKFLYAALNDDITADDGILVFRNRGLLEPPAVPALSSLASLCLFALLLLAAAGYLRKRSAN